MKRVRTALIGLLALAVVLGPLASVVPAQQAQGIFVPLLVYRTGAFAPSGIPIANGFVDYFTLVNERDRGINGVKLVWEECETQYDTKQGVECYERLKARNPVLVNPYSTGITYQLIPKAAVDKVPVFSMGYGMTAAADGRWFPWVFSFPTTYWSQASAVIRYMGQQEGGLDKLKGKKIAHIYHNSPYGREANPTLEELAKKYSFELTLLAVDSPGQEQKATWLQVRRLNPDWIFLSGWGVMNQVAVKEAASVGFRMDHLIGNWWSASDADVVPAGGGAKAYKGATFHAPGTNFRVFQDIVKHVYNMGKYGNKVLTGEQVRWGFENFNLTEQRLEQLGMKGFTRPIKVSCEDHEGNGPVLIQQWNGQKWQVVSEWLAPMREVVRPKIEAAAIEEGKKLDYTQRDCTKEMPQRRAATQNK